MTEFLNQTFPRLLVSGFICYVVLKALFSPDVSEGIQMSVMGIFGAMAHHWLGTSASSAAKSKMLNQELQSDNNNDNQQIAPAYPTAKPGKPLAERLRDNANSVDS